jgi:uncharacterized protein YqeY
LKEGKNMSTIKDRLQEYWKNALKAKDKFTTSVISTAKAAILLVEKTDNRKLEEDEVITILAREVKQRRESMVEFEKGNRQDLVDQCKAEIEILLTYLPEQLGEDEIRLIVKESAEEVGANSAKDMGKVMAAVKPKVAGKADGKLVSQLVKEHLNNM